MEDLISRLKAALDDHLPCESGTNDDAAFFLAVDVTHSSGGYNVASVERELEKIERLEQACRDVQEIFRSLHSNVRSAIAADASRRWNDLSFHSASSRELLSRLASARRRGGPWIAASPDDAVRQLPQLADALEASIRHAKKTVRKHEEASTRRGKEPPNWRAIGLAGECQKLWAQRKGRRAPAGLTEAAATPFGRFCQAVFDAAGLGSAKSALDAKKKILKKGKITG